MPETLTGLIERVTYHNLENGFAVLKVVVKGRHKLAMVAASQIGMVVHGWSLAKRAPTGP